MLAIAVCQAIFMSQTRRFRDRRNLRLLLQRICVRRGFGCGYENPFDADLDAGEEIVGVSLLANAVCQLSFIN